MDLAPIDLFAKISFRKGAGGGWGGGRFINLRNLEKYFKNQL